ncbi:MAG TPA: cellulase family glycosylhydrolase, partial [Actinomycetota bacterium]|nr:cellulase family glycosylhydrolase [Actinomycetota bacterium]
ANNGMWTLIDNHPNWLSAFRYPDWQYTAPYNSHDKDYPATLEGSQEAETDFWTDDLRQQFVDEMWRYLAALVGDEPGVAGYAPMSEPEPGNLPYVHTTTATILDWQAKQSLSIRAVDPDAIIFFTTRNGFGPGLPTADLSDYTAMGNVAFDLHDYFGARLGSGLGPTDPASPNYMEGRQAIYAASDDGSGNEHPYAYTGTVDSQIRFLKSHMKYLKPLGIPMYVGEFTTDGSVDPGVFLFHGTVTSALNQLSLSWTVSNYWGPLGVVSAPGGPLNPWGCILVEAMGGTC